MAAPPHSVDATAASLREDRYADRNNFLYLLLGVIASAERVLGAAPLRPPDAPAATGATPDEPPAAPHSLLR